MRRTIVLGAHGFFGSLALAGLREDGVAALGAGRRRGLDLAVDAEDPASHDGALRPGDVVLDAAGPFHARTDALVRSALRIGFDVVDLSDSLEFALRMTALEGEIRARGIRVLDSCSSVSAVAAALVARSGIEAPLHVRGFLAPAARKTANRGSAQALLRSVGRPVRVFRGGRFADAPGYGESRAFALPGSGRRRMGRLFETADGLWLPRAWPGLESVEMYVDSNVPGMNLLLGIAARRPGLRRMLGAFSRAGLLASRLLGSAGGCLLYEVEGEGQSASLLLHGERNSEWIPVLPAVIATTAIASGAGPPPGLVPPDRQVRAGDLLDRLAAKGLALAIS